MTNAVPDEWGYTAQGPETDHPCLNCGATPTRSLYGCSGLYCKRHCRSYDRLGNFVLVVLVLAAFVGVPVVFAGFALGWFG